MMLLTSVKSVIAFTFDASFYFIDLHYEVIYYFVTLPNTTV